MGTTILSFQDRVVIETLHKEHYSLGQIASRIGFSRTTVFKELHRLPGSYNARRAEKQHRDQITQRGAKSHFTSGLKQYIEDKILIEKWSAEQVAHTLQLSFKTIYNWIDQNKLEISLSDLPDHGIRRHRAKETRGTFCHGRSIDTRPREVAQRTTFGHFEADTVLSGKMKGQAVATFTERLSRLTIVQRFDGRDSQSMTKAIITLARHLGANLKSLTVDHGKEFANYHQIEDLINKPMFFAHAYSPHERGSNENRNRVLRRFIPKGKPIEQISNDELIAINWWLNSRPMKCLNWQTPIEVFFRNLHDNC